MDLKEVQELTDKWVSQFKEGYFPPMSLVVRLAEEVGELAREVNHRFGEKKKKPEELSGSIEEELGDILFIIACFANSLGYDLSEIFKATMDKYYKRDLNRWTKKEG
ncbi:nucleotide pyrophosphohydrolase [Carboxydothermus hydrogenoformans]|uniref:MazG family protein n=1 Tax=Carboxydothermus hydrogenoformans (strain ATCC BAA-161 / DSM 6008 / Z-2901) TaxID=246194 RepID=Q3AD74_CARHZ|nr:nucleotide pyrophosphohydrolase [Carboxydothermus hydrogenoformans]ABB14489.1 MazG family protein [Carboxydothermus hydrogenoformans Z-2901]